MVIELDIFFVCLSIKEATSDTNSKSLVGIIATIGIALAGIGLIWTGVDVLLNL